MSEYSEEHDIDYPVDVRYESVVLHVNLDAVDAMEDPRFPPGSEQHYTTAESIDPPFECISVVRSRLPIDFLDLVEIAGVSYIFLAKRNREIIIKNLETKAVSRIVCRNIDPASLFSEEELVNWLLAGQPVCAFSSSHETSLNTNGVIGSRHTPHPCDPCHPHGKDHAHRFNLAPPSQRSRASLYRKVQSTSRRTDAGETRGPGAPVSISGQSLCPVLHLGSCVPIHARPLRIQRHLPECGASSGLHLCSAR